jgi:hypothetical protein
MQQMLDRLIADLVGRLTGPLTFRIFLQPGVAVFLGIKAGLKDAREGRAPFVLALFFDAAHRRELLTDGWKDIAKVVIAAALVDVVYQIMVLRWFYLGEALVTAFVLAVMPYCLVRGLVNQFGRRWIHATPAKKELL